MIGYAVNYYQDRVRPHKTYRRQQLKRLAISGSDCRD